jgi:hypothetical protein
MNHSIYSADRTTHLKIVVIALVACIAGVGLSLSPHPGSNTGSAQTAVVVKAGKPIMTTNSSAPVVR